RWPRQGLVTNPNPWIPVGKIHPSGESFQRRLTEGGQRSRPAGGRFLAIRRRYPASVCWDCLRANDASCDTVIMMPASAPSPRCLASPGAARRVDGVRIRSLQGAIGLFCVVLGALILVAPHRFSPFAFAPLAAYRPWIASWLLLGGFALVGAAALE